MYVLGDDTNGLDGEALNAFGGNLVPLPLPPTHTLYVPPPLLIIWPNSACLISFSLTTVFPFCAHVSIRALSSSWVARPI